MQTIDEKRVYTDNAGTETVYLATGLGVVTASVSDDLIGEFGVVQRCRAHDVATDGPLVAAATAEDVLVADRAASGNGDTPGAEADFVATGFGPARAVGFDDGALLAGEDDGDVSRLDAAGTASAASASNGSEGETSAWTELGSTGGVRAIEGGLVAAADGIYRERETGLTHAGLDDARDVDSEPLAATASGLYKLGNGWMDVLDGPVEAVDAAGSRALAVSDGDLYARGDGGEWSAADFPIDEDVVAVAHGGTASYAVTDGGTLAVRLPDGEWRHRGLGVDDVAAMEV